VEPLRRASSNPDLIRSTNVSRSDRAISASRENMMEAAGFRLPDGNNVSIDREGLRMAEAQLKFKTGIALMHLDKERILNAIHVDK